MSETQILKHGKIPFLGCRCIFCIAYYANYNYNININYNYNININININIRYIVAQKIFDG